MAGKKQTLTPEQIARLEEVERFAERWRNARAEIRARKRLEEEKELADLEMAYALTIRRAADAEVPISRIGRGMGSTDPYTPRRWLTKTQGISDTLTAVTTGTEPFTWLDRAKALVSVAYPGFPTTATGAEDYPAVLRGVVERAGITTQGWVVAEDPDTTEDLPGWFTWELTDVPVTNPNSLAAHLNRWVATQ